MTAACCPTCGQRMLVRHGERFTPQESDLLGVIEDVTKGRGGIPMSSIITCCFPNTTKLKASARARAVIWGINEKLVSTHWRIVGPGSGNKDGMYQFSQVGDDYDEKRDQRRQAATQRQRLQRTQRQRRRIAR